MKLLAAEGPRRHVYKSVRVLGCVGRMEMGEKDAVVALQKRAAKTWHSNGRDGKEGGRQTRQADLASPCSL